MTQNIENREDGDLELMLFAREICILQIGTGIYELTQALASYYE